MPGGEVKRQSHAVLGAREITDVQRDWARREDQGVQKREHVLLRAGVVHETLCGPRSLITQSLQPEGARIVAIDHYSLVELIEDDMRCPNRREAPPSQRLEVSSRTRLVPQNV